MKNINWTFVITILSVSLGWVLNELSQWFRIRQSDKKIKKQILFNLLETNHIFRRLDTSEFEKIYTEKVLTRIPENEQTEEFKNFFQTMISQILNTMFHGNVAESLQEIEAKYSLAVENLASIDPITAYHLNGKTKIMDSFNLIQSGLDNLKQIITENDEEIQNQIDTTFHSLFKPDIIKEAISDLEIEILKIGRSIDLLTWYKLKRSFKGSYIEDRKELELIIDGLLDKIVPKNL